MVCGPMGLMLQAPSQHQTSACLGEERVRESQSCLTPAPTLPSFVPHLGVGSREPAAEAVRLAAVARRRENGGLTPPLVKLLSGGSIA